MPNTRSVGKPAGAALEHLCALRGIVREVEQVFASAASDGYGPNARSPALRSACEPSNSSSPPAAAGARTTREPTVTPPPDDLTDRQQAILDEIHRGVHDRGLPPTIRELCEAVGALIERVGDLA